jgi:hypothetical protein
MKQMLAVTAAALMLSAGVALAATPVVPTFSITAGYTKVACGKIRTHNGLVINGSNLYAVVNPEIFGPGISAAPLGPKQIARSVDGGLTWQGPWTINPAAALDDYAERMAIAVSGTTTKIVHAVWPSFDGATWGLYYSWANNADLETWSAPVKISGSAIFSGSEFDDDTYNLIVDGKGLIHLVFMANSSMYYSVATAAAAVFTEPVVITKSRPFKMADAVIDSSNNLHVIYDYLDSAGNTGLEYLKLPVGSSAWTTPKTVITPIATYNGLRARLAAYDVNNLYIAAINTTSGIDFYSTTNGGTAWSKSTIAGVLVDNVDSLAVSKTKVLAIGCGAGITKMHVFKSTDGKSWSDSAPFSAPQSNVVVAFDASNKLNVISNSSYGSPPNIWGERSIYFTKEK